MPIGLGVSLYKKKLLDVLQNCHLCVTFQYALSIFLLIFSLFAYFLHILSKNPFCDPFSHPPPNAVAGGRAEFRVPLGMLQLDRVEGSDSDEEREDDEEHAFFVYLTNAKASGRHPLVFVLLVYLMKILTAISRLYKRKHA